MLDPQAEDEQREKIAADAKSKLETSGTIEHEANWGVRKMAYEIDRRPEADYRFYRFTGGKELLDDLGHSLKITDGVLRYRFFKTEHDAPTMTPPDTEQIMKRDDDDRERGGRGGGGRGGPRRPREDRDERRPEAAAAPTAVAEAPAPETAAPEAPAPEAPAPEAAAPPPEAPASEEAPAPSASPPDDPA
jgi:small subunit ribosomal protein S6